MRQNSLDGVGALSLIALGAVLGPSGLGVLTSQLLALVDPAIPVGLAALGVVAALEFRAPERARSRGTIAIILGLVVGAAVAGGVVLVAVAMGVRDVPLLAMAALPGICAFAASTRNDIFPILLGALGLAFMEGDAITAAWTTSTAVVVAIGCAVAGWLLLRRPALLHQESGVTIALLLLAGGAADYVLVPALLAGLAAGVCWRLLGGAVQESVQRDIAHLGQPVLAILLLSAGAHTQLSVTAIALGAIYAVVVASSSRLGRSVTPAPSGGSNILAVAFAVSALRLALPDVALPFAVVVIGTLLSLLLTVSPGRTEAFE